MPGHRSRNLVRRRRRVDDEAEDDISNAADAADDSFSEGSGQSDVYEDADVDDSDFSGTEGPQPVGEAQSRSKLDRGAKSVAARLDVKETSHMQDQHTSFPTTSDTKAMMNGLSTAVRDNAGASVDFEAAKMPEHGESQGDNGARDVQNEKRETLAERRRREHEEYKRKRDSDPAFIPNRGAFFMHDHRSGAAGSNGYQPFPRGRGRGKGSVASAGMLTR
jgi:hypothetical protein